MKKIKYLAAILLILSTIFLLGPRVNKSYKIKEPSISSNVEEYIIKEEIKYNDIRPDTEKKIDWYEDYYQTLDYELNDVLERHISVANNTTFENLFVKVGGIPIYD